MRSDRTTKILLALIAVGLWALTMTQLSTPIAVAADSPSALPDPQAAGPPQQGMEQSVPAPDEPRAPISTRPLRWRVTHASRYISASSSTYCTTLLQVQNLGGAVVTVDVEWFGWSGNTLALGTLDVNPRQSKGWVADTQPYIAPFGVSHDANLSNFAGGYANVNADDPRILVSASQLCRDGDVAGAALVSMNSIPAYPVGATAQYFMAGMLATWTPPMVAPEPPE